MTMIPVILAGGSGTRLWPLSRTAFPKQFAELFGESLLTGTLRRLAPLGEPMVITTRSSDVLTERALAAAGLGADRALYEPVGRNTAPAVALLCRRLLDAGEGERVVGIFPADHLVSDQQELLAACRLAAKVAAEVEAGADRAAGRIVTLGIQPTRPATGYGYIELTGEALDHAASPSGTLTAYAAAGFHEKPDHETAQGYLAGGRHLWNAGMFVFRAEVMAALFAELMPELWRALAGAGGDPREDAGEAGGLAEVYPALAAESLDFGIMDHLDSRQLASIPCAPGWSDVGSWDEVARLLGGGDAAPADGGGPADGDGPATFEEGGGGSFVLPHGDRVYALVGVSDLLVVDTADALLIARKGESQRVKELVGRLKAAGRREADEHTFEHRPWGSFEVLRDGERFKSKILRVLPGKRLSYQSHRYRSEHWVVIAGTPEVTLDDEVIRLAAGDAIHIPQGARHRIANPGDELVEIVEVQLGSYFGEDDIIRYQDDFDRSSPPAPKLAGRSDDGGSDDGGSDDGESDDGRSDDGGNDDGGEGSDGGG